MRTSNSPRTLSPIESGNIYGKFKPSLKKGAMNRAERRAVLFPDKAERKRRIKEARDERKKASQQ